MRVFSEGINYVIIKEKYNTTKFQTVLTYIHTCVYEKVASSLNYIIFFFFVFEERNLTFRTAKD